MFTAIKLAKIFDTTLEDLFLNNQNDEGQNNTNQNNENQK